jgi:endonuclease YncB( thermonuclease family)
MTCLVDGDTGWETGRKWRLIGIDTPEMGGGAECDQERELAIAARDRLQDLMAEGYSILWSGRNDKFGRSLVDVRTDDGRDVGNILLTEGLAQRWPNHANPWCDR